MMASESMLYNKHIPHNYLSKTFQSSVLHTPSNTARRTISTENYLRQIRTEEKIPKTPWGRNYSYGSLGFVQFQGTPHSLDMIKMSKGTHHFGSGASQKPRGVTVQQLYSITPSKKSEVRVTDELIESPTKVDLTKEQIDNKFPAEHPYASHIPKTKMFPSTTRPKQPSYSSPVTNEKGHGGTDFVLPSNFPASAPDATIIGKARGTPYRHELISIPLDSKRKPMTWPQSPTYFQVLKGHDIERNVYYPIPPQQLDPNSLQFQKLSENTERALRDVNITTQWTTTYQRDYEKTRVPVQNIDTEGILKNIAAFPNADIQKTLMYKNIQMKNEKETKLCIEELTNDDERKKRVHFVAENSKPYVYEKQTKKLMIPPMHKSFRPYTSIDIVPPQQNDYTNGRNAISDRSKTAAVYRDSNNMPSSVEVFSATDLRQKFNSTHNENIPDLRQSRDGRKTLAERKHHFPLPNLSN